MEISEILSWDHVSAIQRNGRLVSLLTDFGRINPCYPDTHGDTYNSIIYTGNGRRGDQKLDVQNRALLDAIPSGMAVPLFNKLSTGRWQFLGHWRVIDGKYVFDKKQDRMVWKFILEKDQSEMRRSNI